MGRTTAGLPLRAGEHYERCPVASCATVYRSKRRTRFRCPKCHRLAYALPTPTGEPGLRRSLENDETGAVYRVIERRPGEGEAAPAFGDDVVMFLESPDDGAGLADPPPSPAPGPVRKPPTRADARAARARDRGPEGGGVLGRLGRVWRGSLSDLRRG